jgi:hypothetical protein
MKRPEFGGVLVAKFGLLPLPLPLPQVLRQSFVYTAWAKGKDHKWQSVSIQIGLDCRELLPNGVLSLKHPPSTSRSGEQVMPGGRGHGWLQTERSSSRMPGQRKLSPRSQRLEE